MKIMKAQELRIMKLEDVKSPEDTVNFIEGCLNDFESGISSKHETIINIVYLIMRLSEKQHHRAIEILKSP